MASKTKLSKEILEKINQKLRSNEDNDLVQLINQGHQGIAFQMDVDGQSFLIKRTNKIGTQKILFSSNGLFGCNVR